MSDLGNIGLKPHWKKLEFSSLQNSRTYIRPETLRGAEVVNLMKKKLD